MHLAHFCRCCQLNVRRKKCQADGITLPAQQSHHGRRCINRKEKLADRFALRVWKKHRRRGVNNKLGAEVRLLLISLDE